MLEGYQISYHPVENEDPNDKNSEAYQEMAYLNAINRSSLPGLLDAEYLSENTPNRSYIVVVDRNHRNVMRILRSPLMDDNLNAVWEAVMIEVRNQLSEQYSHPEYDIVSGMYSLSHMMEALPLIIDYGEVPMNK